MPEPRELFIDLRTIVGTPEAREALREAHGEWLQPLVDQGKVLMAGPLADGRSGVIIFSVGSLEEAVALSHQDPYVVNRVAQTNVKAWNVRYYSIKSRQEAGGARE